MDAEEEVWLDMVGLESASAAIEVVQKELEVVGGGRMPRASLDLG